MNICVTKKEENKVLRVEFSIGDIVKVKDYGTRFVDQEYVSRNFVFPKKIDFNLDKKVSSTDYLTCNNSYDNMEWIIVDVGLPHISYASNASVYDIGIRLRNKYKGELLIKSVDGLSLVRKGKKQIETYDINMN
jgi:hypothetical protein